MAAEIQRVGPASPASGAAIGGPTERENGAPNGSRGSRPRRAASRAVSMRCRSGGAAGRCSAASSTSSAFDRTSRVPASISTTRQGRTKSCLASEGAGGQPVSPVPPGSASRCGRPSITRSGREIEWRARSAGATGAPSRQRVASGWWQMSPATPSGRQSPRRAAPKAPRARSHRPRAGRCGPARPGDCPARSPPGPRCRRQGAPGRPRPPARRRGRARRNSARCSKRSAPARPPARPSPIILAKILQTPGPPPRASGRHARRAIRTSPDTRRDSTCARINRGRLPDDARDQERQRRQRTVAMGRLNRDEDPPRRVLDPRRGAGPKGTGNDPATGEAAADDGLWRGSSSCPSRAGSGPAVPSNCPG